MKQVSLGTYSLETLHNNNNGIIYGCLYVPRYKTQSNFPLRIVTIKMLKTFFVCVMSNNLS